MPDQLVRWSWDLELVDVDQDWDLDILVSSKSSPTSYLFRNDGTGHFTNDPDALPHYPNNYDFAVMDVDGDGDLDLATINDGVNSRNHLFINDGTGVFTDETATRMTGTANPGADDNASVFVDVDSDGDADLLVASLSGPERLLINDGTGHFTLGGQATPNDTPGSLGIAVGDLNGDGRPDVVQAQGEVADPDKVQLASMAVAIDTAPPVIAGHALIGGRAFARVHDHQSPSHAHDWQRVWAIADGATDVDMKWYGEYLWTAAVPDGTSSIVVCAKDRRGNQACSDATVADDPGIADVDGVVDAGNPLHGGGGGGCCDSGGSAGGSLLPLALIALAQLSARSRSRRRCCDSAARRHP
jgi:hypothetical protein